jgi:hypothetical protein
MAVVNPVRPCRIQGKQKLTRGLHSNGRGGKVASGYFKRAGAKCSAMRRAKSIVVRLLVDDPAILDKLGVVNRGTA